MLIEILLVCILAAIISIDVRTIGGTMLSRPLILGPLVGLIMGDVGTGFIVAVLVELLWLGLMPIGAYLPVETLPVTTVTVALAIHLKHVMGNMPYATLIIFALMAAVPLGYVGRWVESHIRNMNSYLSRKLLKKAEEGEFGIISVMQYTNILVTFSKNFLLCFLPIWFGHSIFAAIVNSMPVQVKEGVLYANWLIPALGFAVVMEIFLVARHVKIFIVSYILSLAVFYAEKILR